MPTMQEVRAKFPQYEDMSDAALADALHRKFYSDMPRAEFDSKLGLSAQAGEASTPDAPSQFGGAAMNTTAGANEALYAIAGAPVDAARGAMNLGIRGFNAVTGSDVGQIPEDSFGGSRSIANALGAIRPELDPQNTQAATPTDRFYRGVGQGVAGTVAPAAAVAGLARAGALAPAAAETAAAIFGPSNSVRAVGAEALTGAASGGGAAFGQEMAPDQYKPLAGLAGGLLGGGLGAAAAGIPAMARGTARAAEDLAAPLSQAGRERMAAARLQSEASDPAAAREVLGAIPDPLVPGSMPTTGQLTGDLGILGMERGAAVKSPEPFAQRRADQNQARVAALGGIQQGGAPEKVADAVRQRLRQIEDEADNATQAAINDARTRTDGLGVGMRPEEAGASLRASLEAARSATKEQERALWGAVDPDGTLAVSAGSIRQQAADIVKGLPRSAKPPSGEEAAILDLVGRYGDTVPFSEVTALSSRLKAAMREERMTNGESPDYRRMAQLSGAIHRDLDGVVATKVQQEAQAVARGEMSEMDTILANLLRQQEDWVGQRQQQAASAGSPTGFDGVAGGGSLAFPGMGRTALSGAGRSNDAPRNSGISAGAGEPNFDAAARERLSAANAATRERVQTFDNPTLGPLRRRPATNAPYAVPDAAVAGRIFHPGTASFDAVSKFRRAVGDEQALPTLEAFAVDRLRKSALRDDGTLEPGRLQSFRRSHADALRAFPELDARIADAGRASETMAQVATQQRRAVTDAQKGALGRFLQIDNPDDVTRTVGGIFSAQDATRRMGQLRQAIGNDPEAAKGLRQAVADHVARLVTSNAEAGTSGVAALKSDTFQTFIKRNESALRTAGFKDDEITTLRRIGEDLQRANRSIVAVKNPGGSDTAQNVFAAAKGGKVSLLRRMVQNLPMAAGGITGLVASGPVAGILGAAGAKSLADARLAGLQEVDDILADALLNPQRARILLSTPTNRASEEVAFRQLGQSYRASATASAGMAINQDRQQAEKRRQPDPEAERLRRQFEAARDSNPRASIAKGGILGLMGASLLPAEPGNLQRILGVAK